MHERPGLLLLLSVNLVACFEDSSTPLAGDGSTSGASTGSTSSVVPVDTGTDDANLGTIDASTSAASGSTEASTGESSTGRPETSLGSSSSTGSARSSSSGEDGEVPCPACASGFCTTEGVCARGIFVSSARYGGNLGGLSGADLHCNALAEAAELPGDWMAWLSDSVLDAGYRIPGSSDPYVLVDGTQVAPNFDAFRTYIDVDAIYLEHAIDRDEHGEIPARGTACPDAPAILPVWTSTDTLGRWDTYGTCDSWTSDEPGDAEVYLGDARAVDSWWTVFRCSETDCSRTASIYCLQISDD